MESATSGGGRIPGIVVVILFNIRLVKKMEHELEQIFKHSI